MVDSTEYEELKPGRRYKMPNGAIVTVGDADTPVLAFIEEMVEKHASEAETKRKAGDEATTVHKVSVTSADQIIAELKDALNEREIAISTIKAQQVEDERTIGHLRKVVATKDTVIAETAGKERLAVHKCSLLNVEVKTMSIKLAELEKAARSERYKIEDEARKRESTLEFRAQVATTMLGHCTLTETIASDVVLVLSGGVEGRTWRLPA